MKVNAKKYERDLPLKLHHLYSLFILDWCYMNVMYAYSLPMNSNIL